jgi:predicted ester cyclase
MAQDNIALVRRWFEEVWNLRREQTIDELIAAESVCYTDDGPLLGPDGFRERQYAPFTAAFPDLRVNVEAIIADGDDVVVRWSATGLHTGDGLGFRATNRDVLFRGISWIQVRDGKLMQGWQSSNISQVVLELAAASTV